MNNKPSMKSIIITIIILVLVISGVTIWQIRTSDDTLRVGYMRIASHAPLISAIENNIFEKFNLKIKAEYYPTTADLIHALEQNKIDVAFQVTPDIAWQSAARTGNNYYIYFVAQSTKEKPMDGLYALTPQLSKESLLHKTIGHFPGPTAEAMVREILEKKYNLNRNEYQLQDVKPNLQLDFLKNKNIEALFTYEPIGTCAVKTIGAHKVIQAPVEEFIINPWNGGIGIFSEDLVKYRKSVAVNFQKAIKESFENLDKNIDIYAKTLVELQPGLTTDIAKEIPNIPLIFSTDKEKTESVRDAVDKQLSKYINLKILNKNNSYNIPIFEPYEK